jgi:carbamoyl-phosphate synthase large subunit
MKKNSISVGVTALKTVESPQPGFAVARALKLSKFKVIGIDDTPFTAAIIAPYFDSVYAIKSLITEDFANFYQNLRRINKYENIKVLIPCYDKDVFFFVKYKKEIEKLGIKTLVPSLDSLKFTSKPFLYKLRKIGINTPKTIIAYGDKEIRYAKKVLGFPMVVKGVIKDAYIATNQADLLTYFQKIREVWHGGEGSVLLQEFIYGDYYCVAGVSDNNHKIVRRVQMRKLATDSKGTTWIGVTVKKQELNTIADKIVKATKWTGPFELEFIYENKKRRYYLFEINPRLPSWIHLATMSGQNMPEAIVKLSLGQQVKPKDKYALGKIFVRYGQDVVFDSKALIKDGNLKIRGSSLNNSRCKI